MQQSVGRLLRGVGGADGIDAAPSPPEALRRLAQTCKEALRVEASDRGVDYNPSASRARCGSRCRSSPPATRCAARACCSPSFPATRLRRARADGRDDELYGPAAAELDDAVKCKFGGGVALPLADASGRALYVIECRSKLREAKGDAPKKKADRGLKGSRSTASTRWSWPKSARRRGR